jgi:thiol-disulfide isomerase/thioredoxin
MKIYVPFAIAVLLLIEACSGNNASDVSSANTKKLSTDSNTAMKTDALPSFSLQDAAGKPVNLQELKGKKLLVNLWASWCPPCRQEMPSIQKLYNSVDTSKVFFALISLDENYDKAKSFIDARKISIPVYFPMENLPALFNVASIPTTFIFNENGNLVHRTDGGDDYNTREYKALLK